MKMKIDSPAVYTKPVGGENQHSMLEKNGDLHVVTLKNLCLCVFLVPNILQRERKRWVLFVKLSE